MTVNQETIDPVVTANRVTVDSAVNGPAAIANREMTDQEKIDLVVTAGRAIVDSAANAPEVIVDQETTDQELTDAQDPIADEAVAETNNPEKAQMLVSARAEESSKTPQTDPAEVNQETETHQKVTHVATASISKSRTLVLK